MGGEDSGADSWGTSVLELMVAILQERNVNKGRTMAINLYDENNTNFMIELLITA